MRSCEFWVIITDHKVEDCHFGMGVINGLHAAEIDQIEVELKEIFDADFDIDCDFPANCAVDLVAENITYEQGQMSFPETGQWDFPPHYEIDMRVTYIELITKEDI